MSEPVRRPGAVWLSASVVFLLLVLGGLWLRSRPPEPAPPPTVPAAAPQPGEPVALAPEPLLQRDALIDAAAIAADAFASGATRTPANRQLVGRRFAFRAVFGCAGPALPGSAAAMRWEYDPETGTLRIGVRPQTLTSAAWLSPILADANVEAVEGFWIERPWLRAASCPAQRSPLEMPASLTVPRQTLALVELFGPGAPRAGQREGRPYEVVTKMPPEQVAAVRGFALVIEGRLVALPNGEPIWCSSESPDLPPTCAIAARFERVSLENAATSEVLADWRR
jgi:hypothetical protein